MGRPSSSFLIEGVLHKKCPRCSEVKSHADYAKNSSRAHGIQSQCKLCGTARTKEWIKKNQQRHKDNARKWEAANPERHAATSKAWHERNRSDKLASATQWYWNNKERASEARAARRRQNIDSEREKYRAYCRKNPHIINAITARRRTIKAATIRPFDTELYDLVVAEAYSLSKDRERATGIKWNVDHVIPLNSPKMQSLDGNKIPIRQFCGPTFPVVCGLQNEYNFAVITASENSRKGNRVWPDMP